MESHNVPTFDRELTELHAALIRARAMGFTETAIAMERVMSEMLADRAASASQELEKTP